MSREILPCIRSGEIVFYKDKHSFVKRNKV